MGKGDRFNGAPLNRATSIDPNAEKWSDQILYLMRILTGSDLPKANQITVQVDGELPAVVAKINEAIAKLNELKVKLIDIDNNTDEIEPKLDAIDAALALLNTSINTQGTDVNTTIEVQSQAILETFLDRLGESVKVEVQETLTHSYVFEIGAANTDTILTLNAIPNKERQIFSITYGYAGGIGTGLLTIKDDATPIYKLPIKLEGNGVIQFDKPIYGTQGSAMTITLDAGGAGIIGYVNAAVE